MCWSYDKIIFKQEYWHAKTYTDKLIKIIWYLNQHCVSTERKEQDSNDKDQAGVSNKLMLKA